MADVYLNSNIVGAIDNPLTFVSDIKDLRRKGTIPVDINIFFNEEANEVCIYTDEGRARRPLIVVKDGRSLLTEKHLDQLKNCELSWMDLVRQGVIEYLDAAEEENSLIAFDDLEITSEHTHLEVSPGVITGVTTSLVPFGNFLPSKLNKYSASKNME